MNIRLLIYLFICALLCAFPNFLLAQFSCDSTRYFQSVFDTVEVSSDIVYGANEGDLLMDVYEPKGDTLSERPLLILAFGGSFVFGNKSEDYMRALGRDFARKGYVVASIDYRLTPGLIINPSDANFYGAVLKASHDMQACIRFFRKEADVNENPFRIDTSLIFSGGISAGAIAAIHAAYLRDTSEFPVELDTTGIGGVDGLSGNLPYSSEVAGVLNFCGAIGDSSWISEGEPRMLSMHGDADGIVPYATGNVVVFNANIGVDGSASMQTRMENKGIENPLYTFKGAGHTPFLAGFSSQSAAYMDTLITYSTEILYGWLCEYYTPPTSIEPALADQIAFRLYPNPATDKISLEWEQAKLSHAQVHMYDLSGARLPVEAIRTPRGFLVLRKGLAPGYYLLGLEDLSTGAMFYQKILLR